MSKDRITEGNKLIAEFMGYKYIHFDPEGKFMPGWWKKDITIREQGSKLFLSRGYFLGRKHGDLRYYNSWDWLMDVVESIETHEFTRVKEEGVQFSVTIHNNGCRVKRSWTTIHKEDFGWHQTGNKHVSTWDAVIEFIEWYNNKK